MHNNEQQFRSNRNTKEQLTQKAVEERLLPLSTLSKTISEVDQFGSFELKAKQILQAIGATMTLDILKNSCKISQYRESEFLEVKDVEVYISTKYGRLFELNDEKQSKTK